MDQAVELVREREARGAARVAPLGEWTGDELAGAARVLSIVLVESRVDRGGAYRRAAQLLVDVTERLEQSRAGR